MGNFKKGEGQLSHYDKLTIKQKKFVDEYIICGTAVTAYNNAGYTSPTKRKARFNASRLLSNENVKLAVQERMEALHNEKIADQKEVLSFLTAVMRGEEVEQTLIGAGQGLQEKTYLELSGKDRIKAAELLGKRYGTWTEKVEVNANVHNDGFEEVLELLKERG